MKDIKNIDALKAIAFSHIQSLVDEVSHLGLDLKETYATVIACSALGMASIFESQEKRGFKKTETAIKNYADIIKSFCDIGK